MRYDDFKREIAATGMSLREFARLLGLNPNSVTNYKQLGEVPSHLGVIGALVRELSAHGIEFRSVIQRIKIRRKAPRGKGTGAFGGKPAGSHGSRVKQRRNKRT